MKKMTTGLTESPPRTTNMHAENYLKLATASAATGTIAARAATCACMTTQLKC